MLDESLETEQKLKKKKKLYNKKNTTFYNRAIKCIFKLSFNMSFGNSMNSAIFIKTETKKTNITQILGVSF
jgi:urate oxidase